MVVLRWVLMALVPIWAALTTASRDADALDSFFGLTRPAPTETKPPSPPLRRTKIETVVRPVRRLLRVDPPDKTQVKTTYPEGVGVDAGGAFVWQNLQPETVPRGEAMMLAKTGPLVNIMDPGARSGTRKLLQSSTNTNNPG